MKNILLIIGLLGSLSLHGTISCMRLARGLCKVKIATSLSKNKHLLQTAVQRHTTHSLRSLPSSAIKKTLRSRRTFTLRSLLATIGLFGATQAASTRQQNQDQKTEQYNKDVMTIFAHGMKSSAKAGLHRHINSQRPGAFIEGQLVTFDFNDTAKTSSASLGQEDDVKQLEEVCAEFSGQKKVLVGSSRGASTCINYVGSRTTPDIGAVIVESPFASIETLISWPIRPLLRWYFPRYNPQGLQPVNSAKTIPKDTPVFIFCSKDDEMIPLSQTVQVYKALRATGNTKTHLLVVDHGAHAKILNDKSGQLVRNTIHAFYKKYGFPHNELWAREGSHTFEQCQPTSEEIDTTSSKIQASSWKTLVRLSAGSSGSR